MDTELLLAQPQKEPLGHDFAVVVALDDMLGLADGKVAEAFDTGIREYLQGIGPSMSMSASMVQSPILSL